MKKLMTAMLGLSLLTGLATVSFARPDDTKTEEKTTKTKKAKKGKKTTKKTESTEKMESK
jgi:hypothetical protein